MFMFGFNGFECNLLTLSFQELSHKEAEGVKDSEMEEVDEEY